MLLGGGNINSLTALSSTQLLNKLVSTFFYLFQIHWCTSAEGKHFSCCIMDQNTASQEADAASRGRFSRSSRSSCPAIILVSPKPKLMKFTFRGMEKSQRMHLCLLKKPSFMKPLQQTTRSKSSGALQTLRSAGKRCLCFTAQPDTLSRCCHCLHSDGFAILLQHSLEEIILLLILGCL